ncbi:MAG: hypothetical protein LBT83_09380 [Tannerella sp.]|jgi:hypothetical protein|nr:hypothetical protein [Tannerella sp.]
MKKIIYLVLAAMITSAAAFAQDAGLIRVVRKDKSSQQFSTANMDSLVYRSEGGKDYLIIYGDGGTEQVRFEIYNPTTGIDTILYNAYETQNSYGIDVDLTLKYGGLIYGDMGPDYGKYAIFLYSQGIKIFHVEAKTWEKFPWSSIPSNWETLSGGEPFKVYFSDGMGVIYREINPYTGEVWVTTWFSTGGTRYAPNMWSKNGYTPHIPTNVVSNPDGSVTLTGGGLEVTAKEW